MLQVSTEEDYVAVAKEISKVSNVHALELNISCPNVKEGGITFGTVPEVAKDVNRKSKSCIRSSCICEISPNVTDIVEMAKAVEAGGADGITMINTLVGMRIDLQTLSLLLLIKQVDYLALLSNLLRFA